MDRAAPAHPIDSVRVVVDDVPELDEAVRQAARRASALDCVLELVESPTGGDDHAARANSFFPPWKLPPIIGQTSKSRQRRELAGVADCLPPARQPSRQPSCDARRTAEGSVA